MMTSLASRPRCCLCPRIGTLRHYHQMTVRLCSTCALDFEIDGGVVQAEMIAGLSERFNAMVCQ